jgi:hypothetical protein
MGPPRSKSNRDDGPPKLFSNVDADTLSYLQEVEGHFTTILDADERQLLISNVLEELSEKELLVATDAASSRILETLLASAPVAQLLQFLRTFLDNDSFFSLASRWVRLPSC